MSDGAPPLHVTPRNLHAPRRKAGIWVVVFVSRWEFDWLTVPLRGGDACSRRGLPSVSFLTAGGRVDVDFSIIERTCRWQAPRMVLDLPGSGATSSRPGGGAASGTRGPLRSGS